MVSSIRCTEQPNKQNKPDEPNNSELSLAERVGIEPTVPLPGQQFSRLPDSATLAPLRSDRARELTLGTVIFQSVFFP